MARINWTMNMIKDELIRIYDLEKIGKKVSLIQDNRKLYDAAKRLFGNIENALDYAGIKSNEIHFIKINNRWTKNQIGKELYSIFEKEQRGEKINFNKDYQPLKEACRRNFGTVENAVKYFGLQRKLKFVRGENRWAKNPKLILDKLIKLYEKYPNGYLGSITKNEKALVRACQNHYGTLKNALINAGLPVDWIHNKNRYDISRDEIIKELKYFFINNKVNITQAKKEIPHIFTAIRSQFNNIYEALAEAEINYEDIIVRNERNAGRLAEEKIVNEILKELGVNYKKGWTNDLKPDFVYKYYWADAKLKYSDRGGWKRTISKYKDHTKLLIIIYILI